MLGCNRFPSWLVWVCWAEADSADDPSGPIVNARMMEAKPPTREGRERCWRARDQYFACLDKNESNKYVYMGVLECWPGFCPRKIACMLRAHADDAEAGARVSAVVRAAPHPMWRCFKGIPPTSSAPPREWKIM